MKTALCFAMVALLAVGVNAYCPNLCSGHGTCNAEDKCSCYTQRGTDGGGTDYTRVAWTGPDCSLQTCPVARAFSGATPRGFSKSVALASATAYGFITAAGATDFFNAAHMGQLKRGDKVRIVSNQAGKTGDGGFEYTIYQVVQKSGGTAAEYDFDTFEELDSDIVSNAGNYDLHIWAYVDSDDTYTVDDEQGVHARIECSGQGLCDRSTGRCQCFPGYEGEACTRTTCPGDCSGHGVCLSLGRLAKDARDEMSGLGSAGGLYNGNNIVTYAGWDAEKEYGCLCDTGFRGPACDQIECPSAEDPMNGCGGGACTAATSTGLGIKDPATKSCSNSGSSYTCTYSNCAGDSKCEGNEQRDCSGRGLCDYETGMCQCFSGFYGEACQQQTILV